MVGRGITIAYQPAHTRRMALLVWSEAALPIVTNPAIWVQGLPREDFTNHYHRGEGLHIDRSVVAGHQHQVAGWHRVIRVDNGVSHGEHSRRVRTVVVGIEKKILKSSGRSASIFIPMVVKLVGQ